MTLTDQKKNWQTHQPTDKQTDWPTDAVPGSNFRCDYIPCTATNQEKHAESVVCISVRRDTFQIQTQAIPCPTTGQFVAVCRARIVTSKF